MSLESDDDLLAVVTDHQWAGLFSAMVESLQVV